jgi:hypothetical protein
MTIFRITARSYTASDQKNSPPQYPGRTGQLLGHVPSVRCLLTGVTVRRLRQFLNRSNKARWATKVAHWTFRQHFQEHRIVIAIDNDSLYANTTPVVGTFHLNALKGAPKQGDKAGAKGLFPCLFVHEANHQNLPRLPVLQYYGSQPTKLREVKSNGLIEHVCFSHLQICLTNP